LGIDVPDSECGITVDGVSRSWKNGRCLVFDDSLPHEAWNDSIRKRIVLIVDLRRHDRTDDEVRLLEGQLQRIAGETGENADFFRRRQRVPGKARPAFFGRLSADHQ
jgi:aspartyl/asparaginyl beta-hydroxylase (cupin superfamily)